MQQTHIIQQEFDQEFQKRLKNLLIAFDLDAFWVEMARKAIKFTSPISIGIPISDYIELVEAVYGLVEAVYGDVVLNYLQFAHLNNILESITAQSLEIECSDHIQLLKSVKEYADNWNAQTESIRNEVENKIKEKYALPKKNETGTIPMRPVKD